MVKSTSKIKKPLSLVLKKMRAALRASTDNTPPTVNRVEPRSGLPQQLRDELSDAPPTSAGNSRLTTEWNEGQLLSSFAGVSVSQKGPSSADEAQLARVERLVDLENEPTCTDTPINQLGHELDDSQAFKRLMAQLFQAQEGLSTVSNNNKHPQFPRDPTLSRRSSVHFVTGTTVRLP